MAKPRKRRNSKRRKINPPVSKPTPKPAPKSAIPPPSPKPPPKPAVPPPAPAPFAGRLPAPARDLVREFNALILHSRPMLSLHDLRKAFGVCLQQVHNWIDEGLVVAGNIGCGTERQHKKVTRESAFEFYKRRFGWAD